MDDRSDSDEVRFEKEPISIEDETEKIEEDEGEEVLQQEKVKDCPESTSLLNTRPEATATPASNSAAPAVPQLTIFYGGSVKVFDGIPEEKVMEIMRIAAAAAMATKATDAKNAETDNSSSTPPPQQKLPNTAASAMGSLLAQLCPSPKNSSLCKIQAEFPIARRHSLQRFLEKRRDRLVSKNPYPSSPAMKVESDMNI